MIRLLVIAVLTLTAVSLTLAGGPPALAWIQPGTQPVAPPLKNFAPTAALSPDGRQVTLTGEIGVCQPNEKTAEVQATIVQSATGASGTGVSHDASPTGGFVNFTVVVTVPPTKPAFDEGPAQVCGLAISRSGTHIVDIETWCTFVELVQPS